MGQCLTAMAASSVELCDQLDKFWYQQSCQLQSSQSSLSSYDMCLFQLGPLLPVMIEVLLGVKETCSLPILHNLTCHQQACLDLHLLISKHQPSEAVRDLLDETADPISNRVIDVWQAVISAIQVNVCICPRSSSYHLQYGNYLLLACSIKNGGFAICRL